MTGVEVVVWFFLHLADLLFSTHLQWRQLNTRAPACSFSGLMGSWVSGKEQEVEERAEALWLDRLGLE